MSLIDKARVDLNLFVVFEAIHAEGGITRAARRLNLSQPAVSHALSRLREIMNDPLFERRGQRMVPTPLARRIVEPVRQSLKRLGETLAPVAGFDPTTSTRRFTIGMRDVAETGALPAVMAQIVASAPGIDVASVRVERRNLEAELSSGTLDAAIDIALPLSEEMRRATLSAERLAVVVRRGHPTFGREIDLDLYLGAEHVLVTQRRRGPTVEDNALAQINQRRRVRLRCQNHLAACRVVAQSDLVLTMPERHAILLNARFGNQLMPFPLEVSAYETCLYWHAGMDGDAANQWLRGLLTDAWRTGPGG